MVVIAANLYLFVSIVVTIINMSTGVLEGEYIILRQLF